MKLIFKNNYIEESYKNEDAPVINFIKELEKKRYSYLEVGSGLGRFAKIIRDNYQNIDVTCLEINPELSKITLDYGINTINKNFMENQFPDNQFDIVHCSHIIEHFIYPEIIRVLDELLRITKKEGFCIIRSPLMYPGFYDDIDHVRPYPPSSIINYFNLKEQQIKGSYNIEVINLWLRREKLVIKRFSTIKVIRFINYFLECCWSKYRKPCAEPNGYVLILKKR